MKYLAFCTDRHLMVFAQPRERRAIMSTRQQVPVACMQSQHRHVVASRRRCLPLLHIVDVDHQLWSCCHHRAGGSGSSGDEAVLLVVCIVDWCGIYILIIPILCVCVFDWHSIGRRLAVNQSAYTYERSATGRQCRTATRRHVCLLFITALL